MNDLKNMTVTNTPETCHEGFFLTSALFLSLNLLQIHFGGFDVDMKDWHCIEIWNIIHNTAGTEA